MSDAAKLAAGAFLISNVAYVGQLAFNKPRTKADAEPYDLLKGVQVRASRMGISSDGSCVSLQVYRATDEQLVDVTSLWGEEDTTVLVLFRSYG
eukprot:309311-Rhodomonas_salina.1